MNDDTLCYVYGITERSVAASEMGTLPGGLESAPVTLVAEGEVTALVSTLSAAHYEAEPLERATADVGWVGPRAVDHDRVLTWASDLTGGGVVPLPMFSLFRDETSVRAMLRQRALELATALARVRRGREYAVRLYRIDAELRGALAELSARIAELERDAERASPGQRYLIERKVEVERKNEGKRVGHEVARRVQQELAAAALESVVDPLPAGTSASAPGTLLSSASYLVRHEGIEQFQRAVTALMQEFHGRGFHLDFSGPWPPYHFARGA